VRLPLPFEALPIAEMTGGKSEWGMLEDALARIVREQRPPAPLDRLEKPGLLPTAAAAGAPKLLTAAATATLLAYAGAVSAAVNGVMTPDQLQIAMFGMIGVGGICAAITAQRLAAVRRSGG
jgi:hypothetical protein